MLCADVLSFEDLQANQVFTTPVPLILRDVATAGARQHCAVHCQTVDESSASCEALSKMSWILELVDCPAHGLHTHGFAVEVLQALLDGTAMLRAASQQQL